MKVNGYKIRPGADLRGADLSNTDLSNTDLGGADLSYANLSYANLRYADLSNAKLTDADLRGADLGGANLHGAILTPFQLPGGELDVWGKKSGVLVQMRIPRTAGRVITPIGRKCRFSFAYVEQVFNDVGKVSVVNQYGFTLYRTGGTVAPHEWCPDWRVECAPGIHAFLTRREAEEWQ